MWGVPPLAMHDHKRIKERREHEKAELLTRFRSFSERSTWGKTRLSREVGVSVSSVDRWLDGDNQILLSSMFKIRHFLEERERG
jgi:hypothetical protein